MVAYYISEFPSQPNTFLLYGQDVRLAHLVNKNYYTGRTNDEPTCDNHIGCDLEYLRENIMEKIDDDNKENNIKSYSMLDMINSKQNIGNHIEIQYNATIEDIVINGEIDINKNNMALIPSLNNNTLYYYDFNTIKCIKTIKLNKECHIVKWNRIDQYKFAVGLVSSIATNSLYFYDIIPDDHRFVSKNADIRDIIDDISWLPNDANCLISGNNSSYFQLYDIRIKTRSSKYYTKSTFGLIFINDFTFISHSKHTNYSTYYNNNNNNNNHNNNNNDNCKYPIVQYWDVRMMSKCLTKHTIDNYVDRIKFTDHMISYKQNDGIIFYNYRYDNQQDTTSNILFDKPITKFQYKINDDKINDYLLIDSNILMCVNKKGELTTKALNGNIDMDFSSIVRCTIPSQDNFIDVNLINTMESIMYKRAQNKYNNFINGDIHESIVNNDTHLCELWRWIYYVSTKGSFITDLLVNTQSLDNDDDDNAIDTLDRSMSTITNDSSTMSDDSFRKFKNDRHSLSSHLSYNKSNHKKTILDNTKLLLYTSIDLIHRNNNKVDIDVDPTKIDSFEKLMSSKQTYSLDSLFDSYMLANNKVYNYWSDNDTMFDNKTPSIKNPFMKHLFTNTIKITSINKNNLIRPIYLNSIRLKLLSILGWYITNDTNNTYLLGIDHEVENFNKSSFRNIALLVMCNKIHSAIDFLLQQHKNDPICTIISLALSQYDSNSFTSNWFKCIDRLHENYNDIPYLNLIISFISIDNDLLELLCKSSIGSIDKISIALLYFDNRLLRTFIKKFKQGCSSPLYKMIPLGIFNFQKYIKEYLYHSNDIQTVALMTLTLSRVVPFNSPLLNNYILCYRDLCNKWKLWKERCYLDIYIKKYKIFECNDSTNATNFDQFMIHNTVKVICHYCHQPLLLNNHERSNIEFSDVNMLNSNHTTSCNNCSKPLPKCCICQLIVTQWPSQLKSLNHTYIKGAFCWCSKCRHVSHAAHIIDWFKQFDICPVNGCNCKCRIGAII